MKVTDYITAMIIFVIGCGIFVTLAALVSPWFGLGIFLMLIYLFKATSGKKEQNEKTQSKK